MKLSSFIVSILLVSLFVVTFSNYYAGIGDAYGVVIDDNTTTALLAYNEFTSIRSNVEAINQSLFGESQAQSGVTDFVGKFLGAGFNTLKIARQSFTSFYNILKAGMTQLGLPSIFFDILVTIALVVIIFIIIRVLVGQEV